MWFPPSVLLFLSLVLWLSSAAEAPPFLTEHFFLTHSALHVGLLPVCTYYLHFHEATARLNDTRQQILSTQSEWRVVLYFFSMWS
jgi:hypothetical protein